MGCAWSLYFAQDGNEKRAGEASALRRSMLLSDRSEPLLLHHTGLPETRHYVYADNLGVLAQVEGLAAATTSEWTESFDGVDVICVCRVVRPKTRNCAWSKTARFLALQLACRVAVPKSCADDRGGFAIAEGNAERPRAGRCEARLLQARQCPLPPREALVEGGCDVGSKHGRMCSQMQRL